MTQYVYQIEDSTKHLKKMFEVTAEYPIPTQIPTGRTQHIGTDTTNYDEVVAVYNANTTKAEFTWDGTKMTWVIV